MVIKKIQDSVLNPYIQPTLPTDNAKPLHPAQPIWKSESTIAKCDTNDLTSLSKKAPYSPFLNSPKPYLFPPSKELIIRASEAVQVFAKTEFLPVEPKQKKEPVEEGIKSAQTYEEIDEKMREQEQADFALIEHLKIDLQAKGITQIPKSEDEDALEWVSRRKNLFSAKRSEKTGKEPLKELLALVSEHENDTKEEMAHEEEQDDLALKEQRKQDAIAKEKSDRTLDPDGAVLQANHQQRMIHEQHSILATQEIGYSRQYSHNLLKEQEELKDSLEKRTKGIKVLNWIAKGANIFAGGSAVIIAAIALASGGVGAGLAVIPAGAKLLDAFAKLGAGIITMKNKNDQAKVTEIQEYRELTSQKVQDLMTESQRANTIMYTLWKTVSDIVRNMAKVNTYNGPN